MVDIPRQFAAAVVARDGDAGRRWLARLPAVIARLCADWRIELTGEPPAGDWNLILAARRGTDPCVLKLSPDDRSAALEATALRAWKGAGAVRLLDFNAAGGALLLQRLEAGRTLRQLPLSAAATVAGELVRRLAIPAPAGFPPLTEAAQHAAETLWDRHRTLGAPLPRAYVDRAERYLRTLAADPGDALVHADLHYDNVLAGPDGEWLAIDPKPFEGTRSARWPSCCGPAWTTPGHRATYARR